MISGLTKISIYNPLTGDVVQIETLDRKGDFEQAPQTSRDIDYQNVYNYDRYSFDCTAYDDESYDILLDWMRNAVKVCFVAVGREENVIWHEPTRIKVSKKVTVAAGNSAYSITFETEGKNLKIFSGYNILYKVSGWQDSNADGKADNYTINSTFSVAATFTVDVQDITNPNAPNIDVTMFSRLALPVGGHTFTLGVDVWVSSPAYEVQLIFRSFNLSVLQTSTSNNGIVTCKSPYGTYYVDVVILQTTLPQNGRASVDLPRLAVNFKSTEGRF